MKKLALIFTGMLLIVNGLVAQVVESPLAPGVKLLNYEKNKSALVFFKPQKKIQRMEKQFFGMASHYLLKIIMVYLQLNL
jgi:hypothetical protein